MKSKLSEKFGLPPGSLAYAGERDHLVNCRCVNFDEKNYQEQTTVQFHEVLGFVQPGQLTWLNFQGLPDAREMEVLGKHFKLHPLILEDIINQSHPPKIEMEEEMIFVILRFFHHVQGEVVVENVSLVMGPDFLLTFHSGKADFFDLIRQRLKTKTNRIQKIGIGYLYYVLIDLLFDRHFLLLDWLNEEIIQIDTTLFESFDSNLIQNIHRYKKLVFELHKNLRPSKEIAYQLYQSESSLLNAEVTPFLHDLIEHANQVVDELNGYKEALYNLQAQYLALSSERMNEVMKFLTMMGSIFIPLTFLSGIYGMNFKHMPELQWEWGYFGALGLMFATGFGIWIYFKNRKWL